MLTPLIALSTGALPLALTAGLPTSSLDKKMTSITSNSSALEPMRVGIVSRTIFYLPLWAAVDHGWFAQAGLEVSTTLLGNASQTAPLKNGELDVAIVTPEAALQDAAAGGPLRIVGGNTGKLSHSLITPPAVQVGGVAAWRHDRHPEHGRR